MPGAAGQLDCTELAEMDLPGRTWRERSVVQRISGKMPPFTALG
jgi:hypothetical protein